MFSDIPYLPVKSKRMRKTATIRSGLPAVYYRKLQEEEQLQEWFTKPIIEALVESEYEARKAEKEYKILLADSYKVLDRIALSDDLPSRKLGEMAHDFILKHKIRVTYDVKET